MYFTGPYLRVTTPKTTNGLIPLLRQGQQVVREDFLPLSARKALESKNNRLIKSGNSHLVAEIEVVGGDIVEQPVRKTRKQKTQ